jgi:branched-chain amino acid transport system permease protein
MLPSGVIFKTYSSEEAYLVTRPQKLVFALFIVALFLFPMVSSTYLLGILSFMFITMIAVLGLQITVGMAGQINLGQSAFVGIGAYVTAAMAVNYGLPFYIAIPIGGLVAGLTSILFGLPAARIKGFYLALTTVAAQVMFPLAISRSRGFT